MILVTGATGTAGSQVVLALLERRHEVRVFVRDADKARGLFGDAVELAVGDFADPPSFAAALAGADVVVLSSADHARRVEWETAAIDAAAATGVPRIVKLSAIGAAPGAHVGFWDAHGRVERHLRESGVPGVILRPSFYMSNLLAGAEQVAGEGKLVAPAGRARIAMIDPRDVGAAAAAVATTAGHDGQTYVLTGPEAITYARAAAALSAAIGRDVEFIDVPGDGFGQAMVGAGVPEYVAEGTVMAFAMARQGVAEPVTATVESLTGSSARDFASFARDHAGAFAPATAGAAT